MPSPDRAPSFFRMTGPDQTSSGNPAPVVTPANSGMMGIINKLEPFSGADGVDVKTFCYYVDEISNIGKWSDADTASAVRISLRGEAQQYVMLNNDLRATQSWPTLKKALLERYTPTETPGWNAAKFSQCVQRRGESVRSYIDRLQQTGNKLIVPCENAEERKIRAELHGERLLTQFLEGLLPELRRPVLHKTPKDLKEAQEAAKLAETIEKQLSEGTREENPVYAVVTSPQQPQPATSGMHKFNRKPVVRKERDCSNIMCFLCEDIGHISRFCPQKQKNKTINVAQVICSRCKKAGHRISQCKEKLKHLNSSGLPTDAQVVEQALNQQ